MIWQKYLGILIMAVAYTGLAITAGWALRGEKVQEKIVHVQVKQAKQLIDVEEKKAEREIVYQDRVKVIHEAIDDCLSRPVPDHLLRALRPSPP